MYYDVRHTWINFLSISRVIASSSFFLTWLFLLIANKFILVCLSGGYPVKHLFGNSFILCTCPYQGVLFCMSSIIVITAPIVYLIYHFLIFCVIEISVDFLQKYSSKPLFCWILLIAEFALLYVINTSFALLRSFLGHSGE